MNMRIHCPKAIIETRANQPNPVASQSGCESRERVAIAWEKTKGSDPVSCFDEAEVNL